MPQDAACPKCKNSFPVTEARNAFTVACPKCDTEMTVEFKKPAAPPEAGQPHYDLLVRSGALASSAVPVGNEKKKKKDDDDDDEPKRKGGSAMVVLLSGGLGLLFVLGGLGLTAWFLFTQIDVTETASSSTRNNTPNNAPNNQKGKTNPTPNPFPNPNPGPGPGPVIPPKPKDVFDLRPVTGAVPKISAPSLPADPSNVELGSRVGAISVGGGGRYIVMHFPDKGQLGVFDVTTAQVSTVAADSEDLMLVAGLTKVVTCVPGARIFRVYNLTDLAKLYDNSAPDGMHGMAMGSQTDGPLLTVGVFGRVALWDVGGNAMKEVEGSAGEPGVHWHQRGARAAPDGTAFSTHDGFHGHQKTTILTVDRRKWKVAQDVAAVPFPGADGNFYGNGIVVNKAGQDLRVGGVGAGSNTWFLPSASHKDYFLKIAPTTVGSGAKMKKTLTVSVHTNRNSEVAAPGTTTFTDLPEFENLADRFGTTPPVAYDQHLFLIPEAKLFITLTHKRDRLVLRKTDGR